ncbi:MAG: molybdopterin molybdotransferase MoeA [Bacteroidales bacterium]|jgi:molybdopterin molybdotransferase|nr:molybdopterin molybdotransferase MoeA [Bacteroidales bacterium]
MITYEEAYRTIMESVFHTGKEQVPFSDSLGRVLAAPVRSDMDMPPWDKSAVDGYACHRGDLGEEMTVLETVPAGVMPVKEITRGTCSRIMTGAAIPQGADYVFMLEESEELTEGKVRFTGKAGRANIAKRAEDLYQGQTVLKPGHFIRPQHIAVMAMSGATEVTVGTRPLVGVISTGNELVEPGNTPSGAQIRNSNAWQLLAQVARAGATGKYYGIAKDDIESTSRMLKVALKENDVVLFSGGVSAGDFDIVPQVLKEAGLKEHFSQVAMQPGKPLTFFTGEKKAVFGLPGNPVSVFVQFEIMVRPFLNKMSGVTEKEVEIMMPLATDYSRQRADRQAYIPVIITDNFEVLPVEYHGSAHISAFSGAWGIITIPKGQSWIQKGEPVSVRQI